MCFVVDKEYSTAIQRPCDGGSKGPEKPVGPPLLGYQECDKGDGYEEMRAGKEMWCWKAESDS